MNRLNLFVKGNLDVRDSLHALRLGEGLAWNGINEVVRAGHPGWTVRVRHETWNRSDALLAAAGAVPPDLAARALDLGSFPAASQFSDALFRSDADAIVLSVQPDLIGSLMRHRTDGYGFWPDGYRTWPASDRAWLAETFVEEGLLDVEASMATFAAIIDRIRVKSAAPILIYNVSAVVPGEMLHVHRGMEDILSTRIRRFNLALIELSQTTGISVIDIDTIFARAGADRLKLDAIHMTAEGCRLVAEEVVRVLVDLGLFATAAA